MFAIKIVRIGWGPKDPLHSFFVCQDKWPHDTLKFLSFYDAMDVVGKTCLPLGKYRVSVVEVIQGEHISDVIMV